MDKTKALQKLLNGTATKKEIELLKQALASGEISIGGDVKHSIVITGDGNTISLTPEALRLLNPETIEEPVEGEPPYKGLRYFDTSDADLFYGRETLTSELAARVAKESFLAIVGASGSGKSSVARAGLVPAWQAENIGRGVVHVIIPTAHPLESLAASLTRDSESVTATSTLMDDMNRDTRSLRLYIRKMLSSSGNMLLVVDQFEETFTLCKDLAERKAFIENLLSLADKNDVARVVLTLRADFYHHCAEYEGLRLALEKHQAYIGAMTPDELRKAIIEPAQKNGWDFQPGLADLILSDVGTEPGALPLLSHALLETWKRRQGRMLTLQGYADAGGVKKAIAQTAESVYDLFSPSEQTIARGIFLRLTELGEGVQDTRRRVKIDELSQAKEQDAVAKVLKTLADARLVTTEQDSAEVAHEALIREWGTLRKWLDEDRESLRLHRHLTESAQEWERRRRDIGELYRGTRLSQVQEWMERNRYTLNLLEEEFLEACFFNLLHERRALRLRLFYVAGAGVLILLTIILALTGELNRFIYQPIDIKDYWVAIPAGKFQMGSDPLVTLTECEDKNLYYFCDVRIFQNEAPTHAIYLDAFEIGRYEVTNRQYLQCVRAGFCEPPNEFYSSKDYELHPVVDVSWFDAQIFCDWTGGRLPTEAEWEKAARGGLEGKMFPWGDEAPTCATGATNSANFGNFGKEECSFSTMPIGSFTPNGYGLYDMAGNVWEWVYDWYLSDYYNESPFSNPTGPENGERKVVRGGAWNYIVPSALRGSLIPSDDDDNFGFRCARDVP